jgi:DNA-binding CsgD family transcriptional regulator
MEEMLDTPPLKNPRDEPRLRAAAARAADANAAIDNGAVRTIVHLTRARQRQTPSSHSIRRLEGADRELAEVVPLSGRNRGPSIALPPATDEPASAILIRGRLGQSLLLEAVGRDVLGDAQADLIREVLDLLAARKPDSSVHASESLREPPTESEMRVLRLLPTNLSKREIGDELFLSINTIKAHTKHLYAKLDVHTRRQAVDRAREVGLLSHSSRGR